MQRYEKYANVIKESNGKRRYSTMYYPDIERKTSDIYITTTNVDRLDLLAQRYYGDPRNWIIIAKANRLFNGSLRIPAGLRLRIPNPLSASDLSSAFTDKQL